MVQLKVCGITSLADAQAALAIGATYLGFNFYPPSPRYIAPDAAHAILAELPDSTVSVGIFVNEPAPAAVLAMMQQSGVHWAQLHGDETPEYCRQVGADRVIKALRVDTNFDPQTTLRYPAAAILLDAYDKQLYGGTGQVTDWRVARQTAHLTRLFLAGGLAPDNIMEAVRTVQPYAVDVNSGVESAPGRKDAEKLRLLKEALDSIH